MLPIFSTLRIVNLGGIIAVINTTKRTILIIAIIITTLGVNHGEKSVMFLAKKIAALIDI